MNTYIGTSGWQFQALTELSKQALTPRPNILTYYSNTFTSVENNSAFYSFPRLTTLQNWFKFTPDDFKFSIKLNKVFTHEHKLALNEQLTEQLTGFLETTQTLQNKLGAILIQTPQV